MDAFFKFDKEEIKQAIMERGGNVSEIAAEIDVSPATLYKALAGEGMRAATYIKIAKFFGIIDDD